MNKKIKRRKRIGASLCFSERSNVKRKVIYLDLIDGKLKSSVDTPTEVSKREISKTIFVKLQQPLRNKRVYYCSKDNYTPVKILVNTIKDQTGILVDPHNAKISLRGIYPPLGIVEVRIINIDKITES